MKKIENKKQHYIYLIIKLCDKRKLICLDKLSNGSFIMLSIIVDTSLIKLKSQNELQH